MAYIGMPDILCNIAKHIHKLDYDKTSTTEGLNYFGVLHTIPVFRFYFTVKDGKIIFVPGKTETKRKNAITTAILNYES
jgi:hypothetical protein